MLSIRLIQEPTSFPVVIPDTNELIGRSCDGIETKYCLYNQFPQNKQGNHIAGVWVGIRLDSYCLTWQQALILLPKINTAYGICFILLDGNVIQDWFLCFSLLDSMQIHVFCYGIIEQQWKQVISEYHFFIRNS
ncbi:MAG: hypothetical protein NZ108_00340 [Bacteroidia bacterium]|nr:hypothetical protein [Bacteroidia bacterium]